MHEVTEIDLKNRRVLVRSITEKKEWREAFDHLVIATGAVPVCPALPGSDARGIYGLHSLDSGIRVRTAVDTEKPKKAVVIGGGYIGLEMAEALIMRGLDVSLVEQASQVMNTLDPDMGALVSDALMQVGVNLFREETFQGAEVSDGRVRAVVTNQRTIPADIVILGLGVRPNTELAERAGIALGVRKAIKVNDRMQTQNPGVWAAGDCAESFHLVSRRPVHIALGTIANKQGRVAGINLGGGYATFPGVLGTAVSKICNVEVARTGLQEKEIHALGLEYVVGRIESVTRASYYPNSGKITVKALAEKGSGRLLGAPIVGVEGAAKRIDIFATALHAGFTVEDMINLDLSYAPPYSSVWDPVHIAARRAAAALAGRS
ncbi:MAG: flavoprotein oxidoreductase [Deltaproteobacteria bacterium HGW-Deltaproteobacteria-11]|nr:MAG: flavoprotein oxidoreductase [Deltaproteobacteria bacterium HGW-Deltaproteobacteria-11]